ncbi:MAG: glycosidase [Candidatus Melainabacteria bacterium]|nr:MAG: glycosidase [Candidatus Melainabacteria bacterium]
MYLFKLANVLLAAATVQSAPLTDVKRLSDEPVLTPRPKFFDDMAAYNPAAVKVGKKTVLLYRGQNKAGTSQIGYAESTDGIHFTRSAKPVLSPETAYEKDGGIEDPRLVKIDGTYYLTYTGYNKTDAQLCLATSKDLKKWDRVGIIMPANKGTWNTKWTKSGAILTTRVNGKYWMYYLGTADGADQMGLASSTDLKHWQDATKKPVLPKRPGMFDSKVVEPGPAPLLTDEGILLIYNGADDKLVYRTGWVLFDRKDPTRVLRRSDEPFFVPEKKWEIEGQVPNVVFVEGLTQEGSKLNLYYGGGDTSTGVVQCELKK